MRLRPHRVGLFILLCSSRLWADTLSWEQAVREAAAKNPDLAAAQQSVRRAEAELGQSQAAFMPSLSGRLNLTQADTDTTGIVRRYGTSMTGTYNLFNGLGDVGRLQQSRAALEEARASLQNRDAEVSQQIKRAFTSLLFAQDQMELARAIRDRRRLNVDVVELRYEAGRENKGNYLRTRADYHASIYEVDVASRAWRLAQREFARVLGRPDYVVLAATGTFGTQPIAADPDFSELAMQTPAVRQAEARLRQDRAGVRVARSGFSPALDASATGARGGPSWAPDRDEWTAGATLSIQIFSGLSTIRETQHAQAVKRQSQFALESERTQTARDLQEAYYKLADASGNVTVQNEQEMAALVRAQIGRGQYANGLISFQDWDLIENDLIQKQKSQLAARRDAVLAEADWEQKQGRGAIAP